MLFSSMIFIWIFLPLVILINGILNFLPINNKIVVKNRFLLLSSLIFYAFGGTYYILIMLSVIIINYFGALLLDKYKENKKIILIITIILDLSILFYFKYLNMFLEVKSIVLPIGISFFIFQSMSYLIDTYRGDTLPQKNIFDLALYISFFPQLIAGPIVKYKDVSNYIIERKENLENFSFGARRFIYGLSKKVLLANQLAIFVDNIWARDLEGLGFSVVFLTSILYSLQIYYDFSGYSDMAIGLGKIFGFHFNENFNYPYISASITEFWRRWHISLSTWFRDYVYIPLGGNRTGHTYINLLIVFFLTGVWHGADLTFFLWGIIYGIIIVIEKFILLKIFNKKYLRLFNILITFILVNLLWIPFRADNINDAIIFIKEFANFQNINNIFYYINNKLLIVIILSIFICGPHYILFKNIYDKLCNNKIFVIIESIFLIIIFSLSIFELASGTYNPFIYFRF